jgi:hypothetical protein
MTRIILSRLRFAPLSALLAGLAFAGCGAQPSSESGSGAADMTIVALSSADVTDVSVTITGSALSSPRVSALFRRAQQWGALIGGLPVGNGYTFTAAAKDASGALLYTGVASNVTIVNDQTVAVVITAQQVAPPDAYQNAVPVLDSVVISSLAVGLGEQVSVKVTAHDPNPQDTIAYQWSATCGSFLDASQPSTTWTAPSTAGSCTLSIMASDLHAATVTASVTVNVDSVNGKGGAQVSVVANTWPAVTDLSVAPNGWLVAGTPSTLTLTASDADSDPLTYAWSSTCNGNFNSTTVASPTFVLADGQTGVCTLTVAVSDGRGGSATGDITLPVGAPAIQSP